MLIVKVLVEGLKYRSKIHYFQLVRLPIGRVFLNFLCLIFKF